MTEEQAGRVVFELEHLDATGMARNQAVHEYLTYGMPLEVESPRGRRTRIARFFDFDHPESGGNEFVVTTQFRVRRGNERGGREDDERMVIPDLVLFVNGIPLVVMEAKSPSWYSKFGSTRRCANCGATRRPGRSGTGPGRRSSSTTTCFAWLTAERRRYTPGWGPGRTPT